MLCARVLGDTKVQYVRVLSSRSLRPKKKKKKKLETSRNYPHVFT